MKRPPRTPTSVGSPHPIDAPHPADLVADAPRRVEAPRTARTAATDDGPRVLRVAELNRVARLLLEREVPDVWVEGELSDVTRASTGHVYFTLLDGDAQAQLRCTMFRTDALRARAKLEAGVRVRLRGGLSLYEPRGAFQLIARIALPAGEGDLRAQVLELRRKLAAEGLLDPARKRALPKVPRVIGLVTSAQGAAVHDVVRVASERLAVRIVIAHCLVQGPDAAASIARAVQRIQAVAGLDVVIVGRGGGSSEDLAAFDDERVARAIARCRVPVVSAVGHEVDVTTADLVADVRASTPSNAAELVVPERRALEAELTARRTQLARLFARTLRTARTALADDTRRLGDPRTALAQRTTALERLRARLTQAQRRRLTRHQDPLTKLGVRLAAQDARTRLATRRAQLDAHVARLFLSGARLPDARAQLHAALTERLTRAATQLLPPQRARLGEVVAQLAALSPLSVLARGYAIALRDGRALTRARDAAPGDALTVRLHEGTLDVEVRGVRDEEP